MLVMRRRAGESILIGDDIEIQIMHIGESRIKIGITAPKSVPVSLKEVKLVGQENRAAAQLRSVAALRSLIARLTEDREPTEIEYSHNCGGVRPLDVEPELGGIPARRRP
jgi:carbon storage regulator